MKIRHAAVESPPLSSDRFTATPEFKRFKSIVRKLLKVPKSELDRMVEGAKTASPRTGNPNAPGRKPKPSTPNR